MSTTEETLRLNLETEGVEKLDALAASAKRAEGDVYELADAYELADSKFDHVAVVSARVTTATKAVGDEATKTAAKLDAVAGATDKAGKSGANLGRSMLESGRIIQDFAQGGLGGILNNIEGFTVAVGLGSGLAGGLTIAGVAASMAAPHVVTFYRAIADGSNEVPKSADAVKRLEEELGKTNKRLDELRGKTQLTNSELSEFNKLTEEQVKLEKQKTAEMQRQADLKQLLELKPAQQEGEAKERAGMLQADLGGQQEQIIRGIQQAQPKGQKAALEAQLKKQLGEIGQSIDEDPFDLVGMRGLMEARAEGLRKAIVAEDARLRKKAEDLATGALVRGEAGPTEDLERMMRTHPGIFPAKQRAALAGATPAGMAQAKADKDTDAAVQAEEKGIQEADQESADKAMEKFLKRRGEQREREGRDAAADPATKAEGDRLEKEFAKTGQSGFSPDEYLNQKGQAEARRRERESHDSATKFHERAKRDNDIKEVQKKAVQEGARMQQEMAKGQEEAAREQLAREAFRRAGGAFSPEMARAAGNRAHGAMQKLGPMGDPDAALRQAMADVADEQAGAAIGAGLMMAPPPSPRGHPRGPAGGFRSVPPVAPAPAGGNDQAALQQGAQALQSTLGVTARVGQVQEGLLAQFAALRRQARIQEQGFGQLANRANAMGQSALNSGRA